MAAAADAPAVSGAVFVAWLEADEERLVEAVRRTFEAVFTAVLPSAALATAGAWGAGDSGSVVTGSGAKGSGVAVAGAGSAAGSGTLRS